MRLACAFASAIALGGCGPGPSSGWQPAFDAGAIGWFLNVWGPSADDLYAVGGTPTRA